MRHVYKADKQNHLVNSRLHKHNRKFYKSTLSFFARVEQVIDLGSHFGYICTITESKELSKDDSVTYDFYLNNIKPPVPR